MRYLVGLAGILTLAACDPKVPDSAAGVQDPLPAAALPAAPAVESQPLAAAEPATAPPASAAPASPAEPAAATAPAGQPADPVRAFALSVYNEKGQALYSRSKFLAAARFRRNCARYASADAAQAAFLARGGPERDPMGLDPDGDGFACAWDPAPYRQALDPSELAEQPVVVRTGQ